MISSVSSGRPRQFFEIWLKSLCSILFHFDVPGGKWETWISSPDSFANPCRLVFQSLFLLPLLPPPSAVIISFLASGYRSFPILTHQLRMLLTAKAPVSALNPTFTSPLPAKVRRQRAAESADHMVFRQQLFNIGAVNTLEQFMHGCFLLHAQLHIGEGTAIPQHDRGVQ